MKKISHPIKENFTGNFEKEKENKAVSDVEIGDKIEFVMPNTDNELVAAKVIDRKKFDFVFVNYKGKKIKVPFDHIQYVIENKSIMKKRIKTLDEFTNESLDEKKIDKDSKECIDNASYEELLKRWRFASVGDKIFQGETGEYYSKVMAEKEHELKSGEKSKISKKLGWNR